MFLLFSVYLKLRNLKSKSARRWLMIKLRKQVTKRHFLEMVYAFIIWSSFYLFPHTRRHNLHLFVSSQDHRVAFWHTTSGVLRFSLMLEFKSSVPIVWKGPHHMFGTFGWLEKGHKHLYKDIIPFDQMNHINFKCQYNGQSVTSGLKYQVMQIFGQSSLSIPNITSKFWQTDIFKPKFGLFFTFSKSAFKYWADLTITVFALHKCTGA